MANLKPISHRCYLFEVAFVWELTNETIVLPLGCLQGGGVISTCLGPHTCLSPTPRTPGFADSDFPPGSSLMVGGTYPVRALSSGQRKSGTRFKNNCFAEI